MSRRNWHMHSKEPSPGPGGLWAGAAETLELIARATPAFRLGTPSFRGGVVHVYATPESPAPAAVLRFGPCRGDILSLKRLEMAARRGLPPGVGGWLVVRAEFQAHRPDPFVGGGAEPVRTPLQAAAAIELSAVEVLNGGRGERP